MVRSAVDAPAECRLLAPSRPGDTVTVALPEPVDPTLAPWASNPSERLVFHQLYETLLYLDCRGQVQPELAESWERRDGGRRWIFTLDREARFWDGSRVRAEDVKASWEGAAVEPMTLFALIDSVVASGERTLEVYFARGQRVVPRMLASAAFAVTKSTSSSRWPLGTTNLEVAGAGDAIVVRSLYSRRGLVRFVPVAPRDPRDLLEQTVDLMVTADPTVIGYADKRPHLDTIALPWERTYVLLSTSRVEALRRGHRLPAVPVEFCDALARDAVRVDARGHRDVSWWDRVSECGELATGLVESAAAPDGVTGRGIVYDSGDAIARDLAQRLVALAARDPESSREAAAIAAAVPGSTLQYRDMVAHGMSTSELALSMWAGDDFAYVVALPLVDSDVCYAARQFANQAPWVTRAGGELSRALIALVDTRAHVIVRRDRVGLTIDGLADICITNGVGGR